MKRLVVVIVLALLVLGLATPKPSEANSAWVPVAIIGGIIFGAALSDMAHSTSVYAYPAHGVVYVNPHPRVNQYYYRHERVVKRGNGHQRRSLPPQHRRDRQYR